MTDTTWTTTDLHWVPCRMEGCRCGLPHPAYGRCDTCRGHGHTVGGDEYQPCPSCRLRFGRENPRPDDVTWQRDEQAERAWKP